jgi:hypothetical protein
VGEVLKLNPPMSMIKSSPSEIQKTEKAQKRSSSLKSWLTG